MLTAILFIMVCAAVSVLMLGVVVAQVKPTVFAAKNTHTISAAEAGVDATLSQLRTALGTPDAITGKIYGDPHKLPCTITGAVGGVGTPRYDVTIRYFSESPANQDDTWRAGNAFTCTPGSGLHMAPSFALITSVGSDVAVAGYGASVGNRTLETIYTFQVTNSNIDGGVIYSFGDAWCLQASATTAGATVRYVLAADCRDDDPLRMWSWDTHYAIHLSITDLVGSTPLCLTGRGNVLVTLQACNGGTDQMFSWEGGARWRGQNSANTDYSTECLGTGDSTLTVLTGKPLKISPNCASNAAWGSFDPDPRVGAGAAGDSTNQVVNFLEFGRCFDVTHENVLEPSMIIYPCKQDPSGGTRLLWNHKWYYTEPVSLVGSFSGQQIMVINGGSTGTPGGQYCLTAPAAAGSGYPTLTPCSGSAPNQKWTRTAKAASYADSWTFIDAQGRCIGLGDKIEGSWSQMTVETCNHGPEQKWNAPATAQSASLDNFKELS